MNALTHIHTKYNHTNLYDYIKYQKKEKNLGLTGI